MGAIYNKRSTCQERGDAVKFFHFSNIKMSKIKRLEAKMEEIDNETQR